MIEFNSFEEISAAYPLDGKSNLKFLVTKVFSFALAKRDLEIVKEQHPNGWWDKTDHKWHYWDVNYDIWYDTYIYNGEKWILGIDTWDGICYADEPKWGIQYSNTIRRTEFGIFKTEEEAKEYCSKKLKERLEF